MFPFRRKTPAATQVVPPADQIRIREELIGTQAKEIKELNAALLNRNKELINLRAEKAKVGKALSEVLAERDELQAKVNRMTRGLIPGGPKAKAKRDAAANGVAAH